MYWTIQSIIVRNYLQVFPFELWSLLAPQHFTSTSKPPPEVIYVQKDTFVMWGAPFTWCLNWTLRNSSITMWACNSPQRYWPTITEGISDPQDVSTSKPTFLIYLQITLTMVITTVQQSDLPAAIDSSTYIVLTRSIWNASISAVRCEQNNLHLPYSSISSNLESRWPLNYLLIPTYSFMRWPPNDFEAQGYTPLNPWRAFRNSGFLIAVKGVVYYSPSRNTPKIGGTSVLKSETKIDYYFFPSIFLRVPRLFVTLPQTLYIPWKTVNNLQCQWTTETFSWIYF